MAVMANAYSPAAGSATVVEVFDPPEIGIIVSALAGVPLAV
jgi:hypothetical protein